MAQVKKPEIEAAILAAARQLFRRKGFVRTTMAQIAARAKVSEANLYVYFGCKLDILFGVYDPWLRERIAALEARCAAEAEPRARLRLVLAVLWRDLPAADNGFTNNLMQALSTVERPDRNYRPTLLHWVESRIERLLADAVGPARWRALRAAELPRLLVMAQDGFAMHHHLTPREPCTDAMIAAVCEVLLGTPAGVRRRPAPRPSAAARPRVRARGLSGRSRAG